MEVNPRHGDTCHDCDPCEAAGQRAGAIYRLAAPVPPKSLPWNPSAPRANFRCTSLDGMLDLLRTERSGRNPGGGPAGPRRGHGHATGGKCPTCPSSGPAPPQRQHGSRGGPWPISSLRREKPADRGLCKAMPSTIQMPPRPNPPETDGHEEGEAVSRMMNIRMIPDEAVAWVPGIPGADLPCAARNGCGGRTGLLGLARGSGLR